LQEQQDIWHQKLFYGAKVSKASDIWAVGMIFASLLLGNSFVSSEYVKKTNWSFSYVEEIGNLTHQKKINPLAEDLLMCMIKEYPDDRISVQKALKHVYFTS